jgi:hypothetical protein
MKMFPDAPQPQLTRTTLARDIIVLQAKLIVDGLRDLILVPTSLIVGLISLLSSEDGRPGTDFYRLLNLGKRSEQWINLFGALRNAPPDMEEIEGFPDADMDEIVGRLETYMVEDYQRGGMTAQAKDRLDKAFETIKRRGHRAESKASPEGD